MMETDFPEQTEEKNDIKRRRPSIALFLFLFSGMMLVVLLFVVYFSTPPLRLVSVSYQEPSISTSLSSSPSSSDTASKICINTASAAELAEILPGIGEALAERIIAYREEHGRFQQLEELLEVSGIGEKKLDAISPYLTLDP